MTKYCEVCGSDKDVSIVRGNRSWREYFMCVGCLKKYKIEALSRELGEVFETVPGVITEPRKPEFDFWLGRRRPRFLNAEDLR